MSKDNRKQINLRIDPDLEVMIEDMRRTRTPIPSVSEITRQALVEKYQREQSEASKRAARR